MNFGTNFDGAKKQAQANADTFGVPYYIVSTTMGIAVEREIPADETRIVATALPLLPKAERERIKVYQPKTGAPCFCKRGVQRDNCPSCEGTGMMIDFARIRATNEQRTADKIDGYDRDDIGESPDY